ncbi:MAG: hydantoinase/oxoprolinase family protein, partial [Bacteroidota bacterium]
MSHYKIGIDVGGTNTDCVLVDAQNQIIAKTKTVTTTDVSSGIANALEIVLEQVKVPTESIRYVMLGTTHCTNAIVERKHLNKVGIIRICGSASRMLPPLTGIQDDLKAVLGNHTYMIDGGFEFDGRPIGTLNEEEISTVLTELKGKVSSVAITGIFSQINPEQEIFVAEKARKILGEGVAVSMSHQIGSLGLLERENATILNAALKDIAHNMTFSFKEAVSKHGIQAQLYFGQNDGTLMSLDNARTYPVLTIACGPTNSIRGAGALSGIKEGIVIDVGGTTSDAGVLVNGFPRESSKAATVGGVQTNFRMPDVVAVGLGGGTIINTQGRIKIGPQSVGYRLSEEALSFGGEQFTLSDHAILSGKMSIPEAAEKEVLSAVVTKNTSQNYEDLQATIQASIQDAVNQLVDKVKTDSKAVPAILVGGGS